MNKRILALLSLLLISAFVLAACQPAATETAAPEPTEAMEEPTEAMEEPTEEEHVEEMAEQVYLMGADGLLSDTHYENIGDEGVGTFYSGPDLTRSDAYEQLVAAYEEKYGEAPIQSFHAHVYDGANMIFKAIEATAEVADDGTVTIDRQALIEAMYQMEHEGLTGNLRCNEFGDCAAPTISIFHYTEAGQGAGDVRGNIEATFNFDLPDTGIGNVPDNPGGDLGEIVIEPGAPIEIASLQAISGAVANLGVDQVRGTEIAIDDWGGELLGHPLELSINEDDLCSSEGGTTGAQRIIANPQIVAVLGTSCSGAGVPASEAFSAAGIILMSGSNTAPALTATGYFSEEGPQRGEAWSYGYFRTAHNDEFQGRGAAQFAIENLGVDHAATINDGDPYTQGLTSAFGGSFEEFGGEITLATAVGKEQEDMRPVLTEVAASGAELIFFPIFEPAGNFIILQVQDVGMEIIRP